MHSVAIQKKIQKSYLTQAVEKLSPPGLSLRSASRDLDLWPPDPQSWQFHALARWTTCANWYQNRFIRFKYSALTSLQL